VQAPTDCASHQLDDRGVSYFRLWHKASVSRADCVSAPLEADSSKEPNKRILIDMIAALVLRVAKGPSAPHRLSEQQQQEVRARLKEGEPGVLSRGYGVDVETIGRLVR
jgi:hypothetical protein